MKKALLFSFVFVLALVGQAWAQNRTVTGRVTDAQSGEGMPGVTVQLKGTSTASPTDVNGSYSINVPSAGGTLVFSFIGYVNQEVAVGSQSTVNVRLAADNRQISEIVVTGYGVQEKREVAGSIAQVSGASFENQPIASLDKALQGRAAGVVVQSANGLPGGAINVQIRGVGSINTSTTPLYIVDGVQLNVSDRASFTQSNPLASINTNDIESIEVIKDAATAAVYGSQAANGVVIITTKRGKAGRTKFTANVYGGVSEPLKYFDVLNTQQLYTQKIEAYSNYGYSLANARILARRDFGLADAAPDTEVSALPSYDWQREVFRTGKVRNYELSASGGNEKTLFFISGGYNKQEAIATKADFERATLRMNVNHNATDKLSFETNLNLSTILQNAPFTVSGTSIGGGPFAASLILPSNPFRKEDGTYYGLPGTTPSFRGVLNQNVLAVNEFNEATQRTNAVIGTFAFAYKILPSLNFRSSYSIDYNLTQGFSYRDPRTQDAFARRGLAQQQSDWNTNLQTVQLLTYGARFAEVHKVDAQLGFEYRSDQNQGFSASADNFPSFEFQNINSAANPVSTGGFQTGYKRTAVFGTLGYVFNGKYSVKGSLRYDGSSRFGANNRFGLFPGIAAAWNISEENFLKSYDWINNLKLRASWGRNGRDGIGNFDARYLYSGAGVYGGASGIGPSSLPNPDLKWEVREMIDLGIDFAFFSNRVSGTIGGFFETNDDLLFSQPLPTTLGYSSIRVNVGAMEQRGLEFELNTVNLDMNGFQWKTNFNYTFIHNEITKLYGGQQVLPSDPSLRVGEDIGTIWSYSYAGVNPATGRPMWHDANGNITYQPAASTDRRIIGSTRPKHTGGMTNTFTYKGFDLDFLFQYQYGRRQSDGQVNFLMENGTRNLNAFTDIFNRRWTTPGQITDVPRPYFTGAEDQGSNHILGSTRTFRKTDYIRLKTVQFGYNFTEGLLSKVHLKSGRLYVQGTNLFTYDDHLGYDPEYFGEATGIVPQSKNVTVGLQIGF
ncbi:SusC/RagA family TonB-linked outer membrane protein [Rufibacter quisquiliarum]|uniref:TonB-linked SusC/RagA family outer membrane protein n=1 Tax=Rufibacter quisquiliarum TaxID=1549639 RepID=A0A839GQD2_9BACT|nr:TonB-dependent receptor [Rufibacter quisquiliarum]MBA9076638.1 TonB-linked SusC/RagA family outer membrane protein [Rufibacter quisquiliarum]